jgi:hypothetical protein
LAPGPVAKQARIDQRRADGYLFPSSWSGSQTWFRQWIINTAAVDFGQDWLDYQLEIGAVTTEPATDRVDAVEHTPLRYLTTLVFPIVNTLLPFWSSKGHSGNDVQKMHEAWTKSLLLQVTLWCYPYVNPGDF